MTSQNNVGVTYTQYAYADLPPSEQPHARMLREGAAVCNTLELLQISIGGAHAERIARELLHRAGNVQGLARMTMFELEQVVSGFGPKSAARLCALFEIARRMVAQPTDARPMIKTPQDAAQLLMPRLAGLEQEEVYVLVLDARNRVIGAPVMVYRGCLNAASMRTGELFREAIRLNGASVIVAHNHPSTDPSPSATDVLVTKTLIEAGRLLDLEVLDHLVIGGFQSFISMKEIGLGFND